MYYNVVFCCLAAELYCGQGNCFFSVNKEEKQEENEGKVEEENKQKEDKIRTTMQFSVAMQES